LWNEEQTEIAAHFLRVKKPSDVTEDTLALLNVTFQPECDFETLFSSLSNNAQSHLPPKSWLDSSSPAASPPSTSPATSLLSNGRRAPEQRDFIVRARELSFDNEDAFSTLTRKRIGGQAPLRLAHFRKFWEGLDNMAYYWDNSLDEYSSPLPEPVNEGDNVSSDSLPVDTDANSQVTARETQQDRESELKATSPTQEEPRKKAKTEALKDQTSGRFVTANGFGGESMAPHATSRMPNRPLPARVAPPKVPWAENMESYTKSVDLSKGYYRGYRIGNGAEMPDQYRIDCVRAFLEPIAWAFGITLSPHRRPPVLKMDRIRFPVRMSSVAWRGPQDRAKARQGWLDGPVLGMQCRADVNFGASGKLAAESTLDAVREIGGLLLLAQERAREGKAEARGGEGKWWTIKERWGGGPGGEVGEAVGATELQPTKAEEKPAERNRDGSKARRRPSPAELWKILKTANPLWDPKVSYEAIGKDKTSDWDDVGLSITSMKDFDC
jgi:hypothetical protein